MTNNAEDNKKFIGAGILAGLLGASCCLVPLILLPIGLGAAGAAFNELFEPYSKITLIVSFMILTAFVLINYARKQQCPTGCEMGKKPHWHIPFRQLIFGFIIAVVTYYVLHDVVPPFISKTFFKQEAEHHH